MELTERLSAAQRLYLAGQKSLERAEELREATNGGGALERKLDALLTPEMLARSRPPPSYPVPHALPLHPGGDASGRAGGHAGGKAHLLARGRRRRGTRGASGALRAQLGCRTKVLQP